MTFMYVPHEHGQRLCHRVLTVACSGSLTVAAVKCPSRPIGATHGKNKAQNKGKLIYKRGLGEKFEIPHKLRVPDVIHATAIHGENLARDEP